MSGGPDVKAGVGILSIRVERVHLRRWPAAPPRQQPPPTPRLTAAVNFDDPAALEPDVLELPGDHPVASRDVRGRAEAWHGVALRAIGDVLHLELELEPSGGIVASASVPVAAFLEDAFLRGDSGGAERTFELHPHPAEEEEEEAAPEDGTVTSEDPSEASLVAARCRLAFHLRRDVLEALSRGVGLDVASAESLEFYAAARTLASPEFTGGVKGEGGEREDDVAPAAPPRLFDAFDRKAFALESEEREAFKNASKSANKPAYAALTAGVKRFLTREKTPGRKTNEAKREDESANLVELLSNCRSEEPRAC